MCCDVESSLFYGLAACIYIKGIEASPVVLLGYQVECRNLFLSSLSGDARRQNGEGLLFSDLSNATSGISWLLLTEDD